MHLPCGATAVVSPASTTEKGCIHLPCGIVVSPASTTGRAATPKTPKTDNNNNIVICFSYVILELHGFISIFRNNISFFFVYNTILEMFLKFKTLSNLNIFIELQLPDEIGT